MTGVIEVDLGVVEHGRCSVRKPHSSSEASEPRNELAESLLAAQDEEISSDDLLNILNEFTGIHTGAGRKTFLLKLIFYAHFLHNRHSTGLAACCDSPKSNSLSITPRKHCAH